MEYNYNKSPRGQSVPSLADRLRMLRLKIGYSQADMAAILNMNRSTYSYYETGKTSPDPMTLNRIAKIFGVSLEIFFDDEPLTLTLSDSQQQPRFRAPKKKKADVQHVGDLSTDERKVIAFLRDKELSPQVILRALQKKYGDDDENEK